jgi:glycosyltransferase involved in cell wall biosynthesis
MHIAYVCADPGVPVFGCKGCSIHVQEVVRALCQRGIAVDLFTPRPEGMRPSGLETVRVHALPAVAGAEAAAREQAALAVNTALHTALESCGPFDLVYERYSLWSYAGMAYTRTSGIPGLLEVNAPLIEEQAKHRILVDHARAREVERRVYQDAAALIAVSEEVADYLDQHPAARGRIHVVPNGVNTERFRPGLPPLLPRDAAHFTVGFVGSLKSWHGLSILVAAFALLHQRHPHSRMIVVGEGPERTRLARDLNDRGLSGACHLTGAVPPEDVPRMLACFDVAAAPYYQLDGFYFSPLKVYEYMAAELPIVASDIGQLQQLIEHGVNGFLCSPGDVAALADALTMLLENREWRHRLGENARRTVQNDHTWMATVERILALTDVFSDNRMRPVCRACP